MSVHDFRGFFTRGYVQGFYRPANSPDLNPIETLWDEIKDYIESNYPEVYWSYKRLREAVKEAWESITTERIRE